MCGYWRRDQEKWLNFSICLILLTLNPLAASDSSFLIAINKMPFSQRRPNQTEGVSSRRQNFVRLTDFDTDTHPHRGHPVADAGLEVPYFPSFAGAIPAHCHWSAPCFLFVTEETTGRMSTTIQARTKPSAAQNRLVDSNG